MIPRPSLLKQPESSFQRYRNPLNEKFPSQSNSFEVEMHYPFQEFVQHNSLAQLIQEQREFRLNQTTFGIKILCEIDCLLVTRYFGQKNWIFQSCNQRYKLPAVQKSNTDWLKERVHHRYKAPIQESMLELISKVADQTESTMNSITQPLKIESIKSFLSLERQINKGVKCEKYRNVFLNLYSPNLIMFDGYEYLRVPQIFAKGVQHAEEYIFKKSDKAESVRRIFRSVPYDQAEKKSLVLLKELLEENQIYINETSQSDDVLLRFLYANSMAIPETKNQIQNHMTWLRDTRQYELDRQTQFILGQGFMYLSGRDKQYRPTLVINDFNFHLHSTLAYIKCLSILCIIMEDYMFFEGKIENWNIIVDLKEKSIINCPIDQYYQVINALQINFPCTLEKCYVVNASLSFQLNWNELVDKITSKKKIILADQGMLKRQYDPNQLEKKFGGKMENIKKFWPPFNTLTDGRQYLETPEEQDALQQSKEVTVKNSILPIQLTQKQSIYFQPPAKDREFSVYPAEYEHDFKLYSKDMVPVPSREPYSNITKYTRFTARKTENNQQDILSPDKYSVQNIQQPKKKSTQKEVIQNDYVPPKLDDDLSACAIY